MKYLGKNLAIYVQDLYSENYIEKLKIKTNGEVCHDYRFENSIFLRCQFSPDWSADSTESQSKSQPAFSEIETPILKFILKCKGIRKTKTILRKKEAG